MKKTAALIAAFALILCGCSEKNEQVNYPDSDAECNELNIMETENGYYIGGYTSNLFLRYHDRETGNEIMLCNKAECPHDGRETCTATYKNIACSNVVMYNNELYFFGSESDGENILVSLYRVSGDGSALDRINTVYSVKNNMDIKKIMFNNPVLLIHRGYAFLNIDLYSESTSFSGFLGGGYYKINLQNNEKTVLKNYDDFWGEKIEKTVPCGDYIFISGRKNSHVSYYKTGINSESIEPVTFDNDSLVIVSADATKLYVKDTTEMNETESVIIEFNPETMDKIREYKVKQGSETVYDGKLFVIGYETSDGTVKKQNVTVYEEGKEIFTTDNLPGDSETYSIISFSSGKIYIGNREEYSINQLLISGKKYFSCNLEDFLSGNITWEEEYSTEETVTEWNKYLRSGGESGEMYYGFSSF